MLKTLVKIAEVFAAAAALAFVVLLFFNGDDVQEVQDVAVRFPEEAEVAVAKARDVGADIPEGLDDEAAEETTTTAPPDENGGGGDIDGAAVFADSCSSCHGGDGGGGIGPNLQDLDDAEFVVETVTNGRGGMPSFEGRLEPEEIEAVAGYVTSEL